MPPVVATRVAVSKPIEQGIMACFNTTEQTYIKGLKRKDRVELFKSIDDGVASMKRTAIPIRIQVLQSNLPPPVRLQIFDELSRGVCEKYLQWVRKLVRLPLGVIYAPPPPHPTCAKQAVGESLAVMNHHVSGHHVAKREILKLVCQQRVAGGAGCGSSYSIGLEGPPGTGKTYFVRTAIAQALGRPLVSIPLGGVSDASYLLGNLYTYEGSKEGRLATALVEAGCCNPIIHFDEVDKVSTTERGTEIVSTLIHLIDPTANTTMRDRYFHGVDIDFSHCTFVFSYNNPSVVSPILLDRIKRISLEAPTDEERSVIVQTHLVPRAQARLRTSLAFSNEAVTHLLRRNSSGGMRAMEKDIDHVLGAAQLCTCCDSGNDGRLAGTRTSVLDADCNICVEFSKAVLDTLKSKGVSDPPGNMYA